MEIGQGRMVITSNAENGEAYEELEAEVEGDDLTIAFNVTYVSDILRVLPEGRHCLLYTSRCV